MKKFGVALAALALLFTSACGGGGRPSEGEIAKAIKSGMDQLGALGAAGAALTEEAADCVAKALHDSKLSDATLKKIIDGDGDLDLSTKDMTELGKKMLACIPGLSDLQKQMEDMDPEQLQEQLEGLTGQ